VARILLRPAFRRTLDVVPVSTEGAAVALIAVSLGEDGRLLDAVDSCGYHGVVIDSFGGGHLPLRLVTSAGFEQLLRTRPVVVVSRCWSGELLRSTYDFAGSEIDLASRGVIPGGALDGPRARILLSLLLAGGVEPGAVADAFTLHAALR
jgi:L-asparaginase